MSSTASGLAWSVRATFLAVLAAAFHVLVFPPFSWTWLAWIAPLPVLLLLPAPSAPKAVAAVWLFGTLFALGVVAPWMTPALQTLFGLSELQTAGMLLLVCQGGLPFALLGWVLHAGRPATSLGRVLFAPAAWVSVEYVRAHVPFGTPWALLGLALAEAPTAAQIADVGGAYAISFTLVLASAALAETLAAGTTWQRLVPAFTATATILGLVLGYGTFRYAAIRAAVAKAPTTRVALVHPEIANAERLNPRQAINVFEQYLNLDASGATEGADLIVWPENAAPLLLEQNPNLVTRVANLSTDTRRLIGAPRVVAVDGVSSIRASAFLIGPHGIEGTYDKHRLLALAETMPSMGGAGVLAEHGGLSAGDGPSALAAGDLRIAPLICHEFIFPELARAAVRDGAQLLVNLSNDSWFQPGAGPRQHLLFGRLRTIELRRTMVRAANLGPTAIILPTGAMILDTDGVTPGVESIDVPLFEMQTIYARVGDLFAWTCIAATGLAVTRKRWRERRPNRPTLRPLPDRGARVVDP